MMTKTLIVKTQNIDNINLIKCCTVLIPLLYTTVKQSRLASFNFGIKTRANTARLSTV